MAVDGGIDGPGRRGVLNQPGSTTSSATPFGAAIEVPDTLALTPTLSRQGGRVLGHQGEERAGRVCRAVFAGSAKGWGPKPNTSHARETPELPEWGLASSAEITDGELITNVEKTICSPIARRNEGAATRDRRGREPVADLGGSSKRAGFCQPSSWVQMGVAFRRDHALFRAYKSTWQRKPTEAERRRMSRAFLRTRHQMGWLRTAG